MASEYLEELENLLQKTGGAQGLPEHLEDVATVLTALDTQAVNDGVMNLAFNAKDAKFTSVFGKDLVVLDENFDLYVVKDFVPGVSGGSITDFFSETGGMIDAAQFLEEYALDTNLTEILANIDSAAGNVARTIQEPQINANRFENVDLTQDQGGNRNGGVLGNENTDSFVSPVELVVDPAANNDGLVNALAQSEVTNVQEITTPNVETFDPSAGIATLRTENASGQEDQAFPLNIDVSNIQTSDTALITISGIPSGATLSAGTVNEDGSVSLTQAELAGLSMTTASNFSGYFSLTVRVTTTDTTSGETATVEQTLDVTVAGVADGADFTVASASGQEGTSIALDISAALIDGTEAIAVNIDNLPSGAVLSAGVVNPDGSVSLTPEQLTGLSISVPVGAQSTDLSVTVTTTDGDSVAQNTKTLVLTINNGPVANADTASAQDGAGAVTIDVLSNDTDTNKDSLTVTQAAVANGAGGSVSINQDGTLSYDPGSDFPNLAVGQTQNVTLTYTVSDGRGGTSTSTVTVTVEGSNVGPVANVDTASAQDSAGAVTIDVLSNDTDANSDTLTVTEAAVANGAGGTVSINQDGTLSYDPGSDFPNLAVGQTQDVTLTYTVSDGRGGTSTSTVTVTVEGSNVGPVANADTLTATEDQSFTFTAADLLGNDTDANGDTLTISGITQPTAGTLVDNGNGTYTFTPAADQSGNVAFSYTISDGRGGTSTGTATIDIGGVADTPTLMALFATGSGDREVDLDISAALTDTDGSETLSVTLSNIPDGSTLTNTAGDTITVSGGSATLTAEQLDGLKMTVAEGTYAFDLTVSAVSTETNGDTATKSTTLSVTVPGETFTGTDGNDVITGTDGADVINADGSAGMTTADATKSVTLLSEDFTNGTGSFSYTDSAVAAGGGSKSGSGSGSASGSGSNAGNDAYEDGAFSATGGETGGGLMVTLGGQDSDDIENMGGDWSTSVTVDETTSNAQVSFSFRMIYPANAESDEGAEVRFSLNGTQMGTNGNSYVYRTVGDGDDGTGTQDSGWQTVTIDLGTLSAGSHTITLGGFFEKKTASDEEVEIFFDNISLTGDVPLSGNDTISAGAGDDTIVAGHGDDTIDGGAGTDTLDYSGATSNLVIDFANGTTTEVGGSETDTFSNIENATGGSGADQITGDGSANVLSGGAGDDTIAGGAGDDTLIGGSGADTLDGGTGTDTLSYEGSNEAVTIDFGNGTVSGGDATNDSIANFENAIGSSHDDTITGDSGSNRLDGGLGADSLTGGDGADVFVLGPNTNGIDTIVDFDAAEGDKIDVSSLIDMGQVDNVDNYLRLEEDGSGNTTVKVNTSGDGASENFQTVATMEGVTGLDVSSIIDDQNTGGDPV